MLNLLDILIHMPLTAEKIPRLDSHKIAWPAGECTLSCNRNDNKNEQQHLNLIGEPQ